MKQNLKVLIAGLATIVLTNVIALGGVAYNRSGEPNAQVTFSEREVNLSYHYGIERDNKGIRLNIDCRVESVQFDYAYGNQNCWGNPVWLDKDKLLKLGFEFHPYEKRENYRAYDKSLPKDVYLVLELNGDSYLRALAGAESFLTDEQALLLNNPDNEKFIQRVKQAQEKLEAEQRYNSRLFAIDAGISRDELRQRYLERDQYIIVKASIRPEWQFQNKVRVWRGHITSLMVQSINVPLAHQPALADFSRKNRYSEKKQWGNRFEISIAYGKRAEPWMTGAKMMEKE